MIDFTRKPSSAVVYEGTTRPSELVVAADAGRQAEAAREAARQDALAQASQCASPEPLWQKIVGCGVSALLSVGTVGFVESTI
jgi:hypothetical protein